MKPLGKDEVRDSLGLFHRENEAFGRGASGFLRNQLRARNRLA